MSMGGPPVGTGPEGEGFWKKRGSGKCGTSDALQEPVWTQAWRHPWTHPGGDPGPSPGGTAGFTPGHRGHGSLDRASPLLVPHGFAEIRLEYIISFVLGCPAADTALAWVRPGRLLCPRGVPRRGTRCRGGSGGGLSPRERGVASSCRLVFIR